MPISSGRSNIDYEKVEEEERLNEILENCKGVPFDISSSLYSDLTVPKDLLESGACTISANKYSDTWYKPSRTIRAQSQISPVQYRGLPQEYRDCIISDVKRKLAESISDSIASNVRFREDVSYDGTITIEAELDMDRF